jgi:hypothetical protein
MPPKPLALRAMTTSPSFGFGPSPNVCAELRQWRAVPAHSDDADGVGLGPPGWREPPCRAADAQSTLYPPKRLSLFPSGQSPPQSLPRFVRARLHSIPSQELNEKHTNAGPKRDVYRSGANEHPGYHYSIVMGTGPFSIQRNSPPFLFTAVEKVAGEYQRASK